MNKWTNKWRKEWIHVLGVAAATSEMTVKTSEGDPWQNTSMDLVFCRKILAFVERACLYLDQEGEPQVPSWWCPECLRDLQTSRSCCAWTGLEASHFAIRVQQLAAAKTLAATNVPEHQRSWEVLSDWGSWGCCYPWYCSVAVFFLDKVFPEFNVQISYTQK